MSGNIHTITLAVACSSRVRVSRWSRHGRGPRYIATIHAGCTRARVDLRFMWALTWQKRAEDRQNLNCTSGCCPRMPAHEIERIAVNPMSCRCPQFRGRYPTINGVDILLCSVDVGSSIISVSVYLLPPCKYTNSVDIYFCRCAVWEVSLCPRDGVR